MTVCGDGMDQPRLATAGRSCQEIDIGQFSSSHGIIVIIQIIQIICVIDITIFVGIVGGDFSFGFLGCFFLCHVFRVVIVVVVVPFGQVSMSFLHSVQGLLTSRTPRMNPLGQDPGGLYGGRTDHVLKITASRMPILGTPQETVVGSMVLGGGGGGGRSDPGQQRPRNGVV